MAVTFPDKQKWVASLEAAIKSLQRVDATFKRTVSYHQFLSHEVIHEFDLEINKVNFFVKFFILQKLQEFRVLELKGDRRLELNCTLIVSNHVSLSSILSTMLSINVHVTSRYLLVQASIRPVMS